MKLRKSLEPKYFYEVLQSHHFTHEEMRYFLSFIADSQLKILLSLFTLPQWKQAIKEEIDHRDELHKEQCFWCKQPMFRKGVDSVDSNGKIDN